MTQPNKPLCVDLDGTLTIVDTLHESLVHLLRNKPWLLLLTPIWLLMSGKVGLKRKIAEHVVINPASLPVDTAFVEWLREQAKVRDLYLATATHARTAQPIADYFGFFKGVIATESHATSTVNLAAANKAQALIQMFGDKGFDYAGNSTADLPVWAAADRAILVNASGGVNAGARALGNVEHEFSPRKDGLLKTLKVSVKAIRIYQWVKNLLVFLPFIAHTQPTVTHWQIGLVAFLSFCLAASGIYLINDLYDLESDRIHARKHRRPFASGQLSALVGLLAAPVLVSGAIALALLVHWKFAAVVLIYLVTTSLYSAWLKKKVFIDTFVLAVLYTLRVVGGAIAIDHDLSFWLAALSAYGFLSLALLKRYGELVVAHRDGNADAPGRGYRIVDIPVVLALGCATAMTATLVLALHIDSAPTRARFATPQFLWLLVAVVTFALGRLWIVASRGHMTDDPIVFVAKDKLSLATCALGAVLVYLASLKF